MTMSASEAYRALSAACVENESQTVRNRKPLDGDLFVPIDGQLRNIEGMKGKPHFAMM